MKGVVVVTAHNRADFLWACLHRLEICDDATSYRYLLAFDRGATVDVQNVCYEWRPKGFDVTVSPALNHPYNGNSFNTLTAYARAVEMLGGDRAQGLVHLVEDDIFVATGYLRWHEAVHAMDGACFAASACRDQNAPLPEAIACDRAAVYACGSYQSLGVSFKAGVLRDEILPIAFADQGAYFKSMVETLARIYPNSRLPRGQAEQDGLINRVLEHRADRRMIYPAVPRAFHAGFFGANRSGGRPLAEGSVADRGWRLLDMSEAEMNDRADPSYRDIRRCELDAVEADPLVLRQFVF